MGNKGISFFLDKETWSHIISSHDCFNFKSFNPKGKKFNHIRGCPYFAFTFFVLFSIFLLSYFLPRSPFWVFSLADFSSFFPFFCVQRLTSF